jgi:hypothetical protein
LKYHILIILVAILGILRVVGCEETLEEYYSTFEAAAAAVSAGAVSRGWIPAWLPRSAVEIHEIHNLDTNRSMLAFRFVGSDRIELGTLCEQDDPVKLKDPPFKVSC